MNRIYKSVWRASTGEWVVAAETAKSHGKNKSRATKKISTAFCISALMLINTSSWAACTATGGNTWECTGNDGVLASTVYPQSNTDVLFDAHDWTFGGYIFINNVDPANANNKYAGSINFIGTNITVNNGASPVPGIIHLGAFETGNANITIDNSTLSTNPGQTSSGLAAHAKGSGDSTIHVQGGVALDITGPSAINTVADGSGLSAITITGSNQIKHQASGLFYGAVRATSAAGDAAVNISGTNTITSTNGLGVEVGGNNARADIGSGTVITTQAQNGHAVRVRSNSGNAFVTFDGTATTSGIGANAIQAELDAGTIVINNSGTLNTTANQSMGIRAINNGTGNVSIYNANNITTVGNSAHGISVTSSANAGGIVNIEHTIGTITASGTGSHGIYVEAKSNAWVENHSTITTSGVAGRGIVVLGDGESKITNYGLIDTYATNGHGIVAQALTAGNAVNTNITNNGSIHLHGATTQRGIIVITSNNANISVVNNGEIIHDNIIDGNYGMDIKGADNSHIEIVNNGTIKGGAIGIVAWNGLQAHVGGESVISVGSTGRIEANAGIVADMSKSNTINLAQGAIVDAYGSSIYFREYTTEGQVNTLNNAGTITSDRDIAVRGNNLAANSTLDINNTGSITGYFILQDEATTMTNAGTWNLRNFADTTGDRIRDTKSVAISNFGGGNDTVINTGILNLSPVTGETTTVATGEYTPSGALSITNPGTVHGQLLNLNTFDNSGTIDLSNNGQAGDVLVITGGTAPGTNGGGTYISNGGALKLNTLLNQGGTASLSDILVLDNTTVASGATRIYITPTLGSTGNKTLGDGIKLVEVQGTSAPGSFTLGAPVTYGVYEYIIGQGTGADAQNWYLQNFIRIPPVVDPGDKETGKIWLTNPNAGSYLANQHAAATMFNQNILDRRDNVRYPDQTLWVRANHSDTSTNLLEGHQNADISTTLIQLGADLYKDDNQNGIVAGLYLGYGTSDTDTRSNQTGTKASGKVQGYQIGAYLSWMPEKEENKGPYADLWAHYAWYDNKLSGQAQSHTSSYDSTGYALSAEIGYSIQLDHKENGSAWILEPHAQAIYSHLDADNFYDSHMTLYSANQGSGWQTRLGARLYGQKANEDKGVTPFIELNWLHNNLDNQISLNGIPVDSQIGRNVGELKLGVQGEIKPGVSLWGHLGLQNGSQDYRRYEVQLGIGWQW